MKCRQCMSVPTMLTITGLLFSTFAQNTLSLRLDSATTTINKALYGALFEDWGRDIYGGAYVGESSPIPNTSGMRNDVIAALKDAGVSCLEWPGGCAAERYKWRNGLGPKASRPGGEMVAGLGTAEYFQLCQMVGCDAYICGDMTTESVASMVAWLNYIDSVPAWRNMLKYWKIGNERWGGCGSGVSVTTYVNDYNTFKNAIPAKFNNLTLIADGGSAVQMTTWMDTMMRREIGGTTDGLSMHYYAVTSWNEMGPSIGFTVEQYYAQLRMADTMEVKIKGCEATMNKYDPNCTMGLMLDEWGAWYEQLPGMGLSFQQSTVRDAIIAAMHFNMFNNHCKRVKMALVAQPVDVIQSLVLTKNSLTDSSLVKTPTFYVMKMFKPHQNAKMVPATLSCPRLQNVPVISASASIDSTGKLHISLCNIDVANNQSLAISLVNAPQSYTTISGQIVNGPTDSSYNDFNKAENVNIQTFPASGYTLNGTSLNVTLPAHSVVMLTLAGATGVKAPVPYSIFNSHSIKSFTGGKIIVDYTATTRTPVLLALYSADGKMTAFSKELTLEPGQNSIAWQPKGLSYGLYVVKMTIGRKMISQRVLFTK